MSSPSRLTRLVSPTRKALRDSLRFKLNLVNRTNESTVLDVDLSLKSGSSYDEDPNLAIRRKSARNLRSTALGWSFLVVGKREDLGLLALGDSTDSSNMFDASVVT